uniref:Uncharacterized protein n=1 Tax=Kalanchoe fedtschenkoi TaxID=63787 RepID=A0A7N0T9H6_KALFE
MARFEMNGRDSGRIVRFSGWGPGSDDDDDVFGFSDFADGTSSSDGSCSSGEWVAGKYAGHEIEDDDEDANSANVEEQRAFWASQEQLVLATLYRTSSLETKVRHATKQALKDAQRLQNGGCSCSASSAGSSCRSCLRSYISDQLRTQGFNASICKSKWRSSSEILSGEHTYLQVTDDSNRMRGEIKVIIELGFRVEFEMLKGGKEYTELVSKLPEVFVGKSERLQGLVKILCKAANKCMKDRNMHVGPWRKERYMLAKWFGACERIRGQFPVPAYEASRRPMKPRTSLLSFDVFERCKEVRVV